MTTGGGQKQNLQMQTPEVDSSNVMHDGLDES